ncbi:hypothetical protein VTJ83DRAFT_3462 [Remersonia thermophila]|uniref:L-serine ammonia-lyase n=1 Tax=Remersonia thermophila TaxID=72144 RepID=A0ABR4DE75_9PEZI
MGSVSTDPPKPWVETPLIFSPPLSREAGCNIYLKLENVQPSGSFKSRGIGNMMYNSIFSSPASSSSEVHFFCSSGGNAGLACATTASVFRRPATIVVPLSTSDFMVSKLRELGAEVIQTGASWVEADAFLRETLLRPDPAVRKVYVPPFDHPDIWAGVASLVDELAVDVARGRLATGSGRVDGVVCNVGGGGLLNGLMEGLERHAKLLAAGGPSGSGGPQVLAVETVGADSLHASVRAGELVTLPAITSIATSLGARRVSDKTWEWWVRKGVTEDSKAGMLVSATVTDRDAAAACVRFLDDARLLIEVSCGATVATAYNGGLRKHLGAGLTDQEWATRNIVLVVCGGSGASWEILEKCKATYGI